MSRKKHKKRWRQVLGLEPPCTKPKPFIRATTMGVASCPVCQGSGFELGGARAEKAISPCRLCHGRKVISMAICRGCGRPAAWRRHGVTYCGGKLCRRVLMAKALEVDNQGFVKRLNGSADNNYQAWRDEDWERAHNVRDEEGARGEMYQHFGYCDA